MPSLVSFSAGKASLAAKEVVWVDVDIVVFSEIKKIQLVNVASFPVVLPVSHRLSFFPVFFSYAVQDVSYCNFIFSPVQRHQ